MPKNYFFQTPGILAEPQSSGGSPNERTNGISLRPLPSGNPQGTKEQQWSLHNINHCRTDAERSTCGFGKGNPIPFPPIPPNPKPSPGNPKPDTPYQNPSP